ncbi:MAG: glycosyl hydrolase-related protein, partial [Bacilli bacterium]
KNQPHDSICGCSIDDVHQEMEVRTQKIITALKQYQISTLDQMYKYTFGPVAPFNNYLYAHHLLLNQSNKVFTTTIFTEIKEEKGSLIILDEQRNKIPFQILKRTEKEGLFRGVFQEPQYAHTFEYELAIYDTFQGIECKKYHIELTSEVSKQEEFKSFIENEWYQISVINNQLVIKNKLTNQEITKQHQISATLDAGDTYNYSPPLNDVESNATIKSFQVIKQGPLVSTMKIDYELESAQGLNEERQGASNARCTSYYTSYITVSKNDTIISFRTVVNNKAKDQKVTLNFKVNDPSNAIADMAFDLIKTQPLKEISFDALPNKEVKANTNPSSSLIKVDNLLFVHRGLHEFELDLANSNLKVTLLRCVSSLSRRDLRTRGNGAGPSFLSPQAQCLKEYEYIYGISFIEESIKPSLASEFRVPIVVAQSSQNKDAYQIMNQVSESVTFSSIEQVAHDTYALRLYNQSDINQSETINLAFSPKQVSEVLLTGQVVCAYEASKQVKLAFKPKEIKTIWIKK